MRLSSNETYGFLANNIDLLERVRQCDLMNESRFLSWCKSLHVNVSGVVEGDIGDFWRRGWLRCEEYEIRAREYRERLSAKVRRFQSDDRKIGEIWPQRDNSEQHVPSFHPFRVFPLFQIIEGLKLGWSVSSVLCEDFPKTIEKAAAEKWKGIADGNLVPLAETCNGVADVAIALEPVYWPWITSRFRGRSLTADDELDSIHDGYRDEALKFVRSIELERLKHAHELLRIRAAMLEDNTDLYRLIRSANWATRHNIKGETGLAMWIRHMAEVLRRGTEEAHDVQLEEEDVAFGMWHKSGRKLAFGSDRALDHPSYYRKELLQRMGLDVSVRVKWYVEGATEVGFLNAALGGIRDSQVEVVDCKGKFTGDALVELFEDLKRDKAAERFSFVSADADVSANIAAIKRMVSNDLIVGYIPIYNPDFEFANFTIEELVTAAIYYDKEDDYPTDSSNLLDVSLFAGVRNGHDFEQKYIEIHEGTRREVKGMAWGRALWETVKANLDLPGGGERPVIAAIRVAYMSADVEYRYQQEQFRIDSGTLGIVKRD